MSDLSLDWCRVCGQPSTTSGLFYFTPENAKEFGICSECIDGLVAARAVSKETDKSS
jgi:hypothetical protein